MKILIRGTNWIGDAVMSIPALRELRRVFSDAHITLHARSWADGLFMDASFIDEIVTFDKHRWKIKDVYDNSQFLRDDRFDLAVLLPNSFESALTSFLTRIPRRIGYNKDVRGLLLTDPIAVPEWKDRRHEVFYYLNLAAEAQLRVLSRDTITGVFPDISLDLSQERREAIWPFLRRHGIDTSKALIALGVGSTNSRAKRWPAENYARVNDRLQEALELNVALVGSEADNGVAMQVKDLCRRPPVNLCGKTDLAQVVALLAESNLLISNDMGLAHIAAAVGTRTIVIFGPTNPETTRPFSGDALVIREPVECSPCMLRDCPIDHRCMTRISADRVFQAAIDLMSENSE